MATDWHPNISLPMFEGNTNWAHSSHIHYARLYDHFKTWRLYKRISITHIQLNHFDFYSLIIMHPTPTDAQAKRERLNLSFLPVLKQIRVVLLRARGYFADDGKRLITESQLKGLLTDDRKVEIVFEKHPQKRWNDYAAG